MMRRAWVVTAVYATGCVLGIIGGLVNVRPAAAEIVTLSRVYALVLDRNEEALIAREGVQYAEQEKQRARSRGLPTVTASGTYTVFPEKTVPLGGSPMTLQPKHSSGMEVSIEQSLYAGGKYQAGMKIATRGIEAARMTYNLTREALLFRVAQVYYGVLKAQRQREAQQRNVERLLEHRRLAELRVKVGEVTESVLFRAQAEVASTQALLVTRENDLATRRRELQLLTGLPDGFEVAEPSVPDVPGTVGPHILETAMKNRDDVRRDEVQEAMAEERVTMARGQFRPRLVLLGTYFTRDQDPRSTLFIQDSWAVGARVEWPLFEGGLRTAELAQARSALEQSRLQTAGRRKQVDLDTTRASLTLEAVTRILQSREEQVKFATKNYEVVSKQFMFGLTTNSDLLDANQVLVEAERDLAATTYDRHLAILDLQRSVGTFFSQAIEASQIKM